MKKSFIVSCLLLDFLVNANGQWYVRKYDVADINLLSQEQLEESLLSSKKDLLYSGIIASMGAGIFLAAKYLPYDEDENPTILEQLIGEKGMNDILIVTGVGILAGGTITCIAYLGRMGRIRSTINRNYPASGSLHITPVVVLNRYPYSFCPGLMLTFSF